MKLIKLQIGCTNANKTKFILFRTKSKKPKYTINISINNNNIKQVKNTTFLGIIIDEFLTWCNHLDLINSCDKYESPTYNF